MTNKVKLLIAAVTIAAFAGNGCSNDEDAAATTATTASAVCSPSKNIPSNMAAPAEFTDVDGSDGSCTAGQTDCEGTPNSGDTAKVGSETVTHDGTHWVYDMSGTSCIGIVGGSVVGSGLKLKLAAGTTVVADTTQLSYLSVRPGAAVDFQGTSSNPIVFTSGAAVGSRKQSDWGGIVIHGKAPTNSVTDAVTASDTEVQTGSFGGTDRTDNSGIIKYVRIEFAGYELAAGKEFNGLFLAGVGNGTDISYLQVHRGSDDGVEIFGGAVSPHHVVLTYNDDDGFDLDEGWMGHAHHFFIAKGNDVGDHVIEYDGLGKNADRATQSVFSNFTMIGQGTAKSNDDDLLVVKKSGALAIVNSVFANFTDQYIGHTGESGTTAATTLSHFANVNALSTTLDDASGNKYVSAMISNYFENIVISGSAVTSVDNTFIGTDTASGSVSAVETAFANTPTADNNEVKATATAYTSTDKVTSAANLVPATVPSITTMFKESVTDWSGQTLDLTGTTYVGAFDGTTNWADGWVSFPTN